MGFGGGGGGGSIGSATDAALNNPANNDVLTYNGGLGKWQNEPAAVATNATSSAPGVVQLTGDLGGSATSPTVPGLGGKEPMVTAGTTSQYYRGDKSFQTLDKTAVGLTNVDNTSDATKNSATATLANKTISGINNAFSYIPESAVTNLTTDLAAKATDSATVHINTAETITSTKTFPFVQNMATIADTTYTKTVLTFSSTSTNSNNYLNIQANDSSAPVRLNATGGDTNISVDVEPKGNGRLQVSSVSVPTVSSTDTLTGKTMSGSSNTFSNIPESAVTNLTTDLTAKAPVQSAVSVQTNAYTASVNQIVPADATSTAFNVTLPTAPADKSRVTVKKIDTSTNAVTVACGGSDVLNKTGGSTTASLSLQNQSVTLQYATTGSIWYVVSDDVPLSQLDARYALASAAGTKTMLIANAAALPAGTPAGVIVVVQS